MLSIVEISLGLTARLLRGWLWLVRLTGYTAKCGSGLELIPEAQNPQPAA
jgi:hypothetical protein